MRVTAHRETPGIGDFIDHERDLWLPARDGQPASGWDNLDAVSGATVTSSAIQRAASTLFDVFEREVTSCAV